MAAATPRWGFTASVLAVSVAVGVWILHQAGWLSGWDAYFYDRLLSATVGWREPAPRVLTVSVAREDSLSDAQLLRLLETLRTLGAKEVVFSFLPTHGSREFYQRAAERKDVVFGRRLRPVPEDPEMQRVEAWPSEASNLELVWGVVYLPPALRGVYRYAQADATVGGRILPTVEMRAASLREGGLAAAAVPERFLVNFIGRPGSIPTVEAGRVLANDLVAHLVAGKTVLVGLRSDLVELETPVCRDGQTMSVLEFRAQALQTLVDGEVIWPLGGGWTLLLVVALGLASSLLYQRFTSLGGMRLVGGIVVGCGLACALGLGVLRIWIPAGTLVLAQVSQFGLTLMFRSRLTNLALNELRLHFLAQIKERLRQENVLFAPAFWDYILAMVNQTMAADRMVFLARVPRTRRLREVKRVNCLPQDVLQQGSSLDVAVFAEAVKAQAPTRTEAFLKPLPEGEAQYLCPLIWLGEVYGIWVVSLGVNNAGAVPEPEAVLTRLSRQVARLMHERERAAPVPTLWMRMSEWFSGGREARTHFELRSTAGQLEEYFGVLETLLSRLSAGIVVYDWFGRLLYHNGSAQRLLGGENFNLGRASAEEALKQLTRAGEAQVRSMLSRVLLEGSLLSLSIQLASQGDRQFLLRVHPLSRAEEVEGVPEAFSGQGLVFELIDTTLFSSLAILKSVVADRLGVELRDHLGAIEVSAALLEESALAAGERGVVLAAIHQKIAACVHVLTECQKYLGREADTQVINCHPLDGLEVLREACQEVGMKAADRRVTFNVEQPQLMEHVLAAKQELKKVFVTILGLLIGDAAENTVLKITVAAVQQRVIFRFTNSGFGIPNDRLQNILTSAALPASEEFQLLREALAWVRNWSGTLEVTSGVGTGYCVVVQLRQFQLSSFLAMGAV